jgi:hypothetical protein
MLKYGVQEGDLVAFNLPQFIAYAHDGITSSYKFEVIKKEVDPLATHPKISWMFAYAGVISPTIQGRGYSTPSTWENNVLEQNDREPLAAWYRVEGFETTQVAGFVGETKAGVMSNGIQSFEWPTDTENTYTANKETYVYISLLLPHGLSFIQTAPGAGQPADLPNYFFCIACVTTDGAGITGVSMSPAGYPIADGKLGDGSVDRTAVFANDVVHSGAIAPGAIDDPIQIAPGTVHFAQTAGDTADSVAMNSNYSFTQYSSPVGGAVPSWP